MFDIDKPKSTYGYIIGECNCCHAKNVRVYEFERRYGKYLENVFIDKLCRRCWMELDDYIKKR
jgi:hypothetical protein